MKARKIAASDAQQQMINEVLRRLLAVGHTIGEISQGLVNAGINCNPSAVATWKQRLNPPATSTSGGRRAKKDLKGVPTIDPKDITPSSEQLAEESAASAQTTEPKFSFKQWLSERVRTLHSNGTLDVSRVKVHSQLMAEMPPHFSHHKSDFTVLTVAKLIDDLFWKPHTKDLKDAFVAEYTPEELYDILSKKAGELTPSLWMIVEKYEELGGIVSAPRTPVGAAHRGINRIDFTNAVLRELPASSFEKPLHLLPDHSSNDLDIAVIASPKIGLPYNPIIEENLLRCGIATARKRGAHALLIGGGLFHHDFTKTVGPAAFIRNLVAADQLDIDLLAECYRDEARDRIGTLQPIYETAAERFAKLLRGWWKVTRRPEFQRDTETDEEIAVIGAKPEFEGPVYVVLAPEDLALVALMAYYHHNFERIQDDARAKARLRIATRALDEAKSELFQARLNGWSLKFYRDRCDEAEEAFVAASDGEARTRNTNFSKMRMQEVFESALSYLIQKIEETIPNASVIAQNRAYIKFGKNTQILCFVSGEAGNPFYAELGNYGVAQLGGRLPDATIVMHPGAVYPRGTVRANYLNGKMAGESAFMELPTLLDKKPIVQATRGMRSPYKAVRSVADSMYESGMAVIKVRDQLVPQADILSDRLVRSIAIEQKKGRAPLKYLWLMHKTDWHFGGAMRYRLTDHHGLPIACTETALALLLRSGIEQGCAHVAGFIANDDGVHGNHFGTHKQNHPNEMPTTEIFHATHEALDAIELLDNPDQIKARCFELATFLGWQLDFRVPHNLTGQHILLSQTLFGQFLDVFAGILRRANKSNVVVRGISEYTGQRYDSRDVGIINMPTGNHASKSVDYMDLEGVHIADKLRLALKGMSGLRNADLTALVKAPLLQREAEGVGTIQIGDAAPWGLNLLATPPKRDSWKDLLHGWVMVNKNRGNITTALDRLPVLHFTGDKHFYAWCHAGGDSYFMGSADTHTDGFANMAGGLPENVFGADFVGLPAEGPDSGPILSVHLSVNEMQPYIGHRTKPFPWHDVLPNRL